MALFKRKVQRKYTDINANIMKTLERTEDNWNLERRASSGFLVWRKNESKVRFRHEVEVLEYEKDTADHLAGDYNSIIPISNTMVVCATCVAAIAITYFLPWYFVGSS